MRSRRQRLVQEVGQLIEAFLIDPMALQRIGIPC